ncbi:hypothetical protein PILCRDRAFT_2691 [Piloderma croceum F 1598]|uniref:CxC5 like cysteine cluster associated with KDZ domain-containing protein n=1 Tax=Piloderma croceum (strain F 1598) TaxID=765440 RepID=A0A0C3CI73_PILCF|nr:hypothetical protein PILCRDRAFT_2691 [Piloderma croceum F 1598]
MSWKVSHSDQTQNEVQLTWNVHVVEYVNNIYRRTTVHVNSSKGTVADSLPKDILILGPHFVPPSYLHVEKWQKCPAIEPMTGYLKPLIVVHPFYYPGLTKCPQCDSINVKWDSWTTKGHREVHGIRQEECTLGMQLRCKDCEMHFGKGKGGDPTKGKYCFATTNALFWERREAWEMPCGIPYFLKRCALTRELFDMIIELRPSSTSAGLAENIKWICISVDNTFWSAGKASIADSKKKQTKVWKGGMMMDGKGAEYWSKEEQAVKLEAAFEKWSRKGGVWSVAAAQVYADQMNHV